MFRLLLLLIFSICNSAQNVKCQSIAVKSIPLAWVDEQRTAVVVPLAVEYTTEHRFGTQVVLGFMWNRLTQYFTPYRQSEYMRHYHLNIGTRQYLGKKHISRSWFIGVNWWRSFERQYSKEPIKYPVNSNDFALNIGGTDHYFAVGALIGKNFALGKRWFIETKICGERLSSRDQSDWEIAGVRSSNVSQYKDFILRPSVLVGYRW